MELQIYMPITSTKKWSKLLKPKHWKDKRSAKELAKSIFDNGTFSPLLESVLTRFKFPVPAEMSGCPEKETPLPWGTGRGRVHDLLLKAKDGSLLVGVEAKADEPFDDTIENKRNAAKEENADGGANMSARLDGIINFLYKGNPPTDTETLMYQLLSATAGVILEAINNNIKKACMMFLVFYSNGLNTSRLENNENDWKQFCKSIDIDESGGIITIEGVNCLIVKEQIDLQ